ncbi:uncharacterized protein LOC127362972 [Dicentrarchus labrax]|uniref:uncharacterized protein LOC127362972 n=1 Tax=Dicentrarchus labrax TaxID=13489 RepID=UPI0021F67F5E|nr:uncharacterized protein LOC127362972 [Dicentrarchus labrax]
MATINGQQRRIATIWTPFSDIPEDSTSGSVRRHSADGSTCNLSTVLEEPQDPASPTLYDSPCCTPGSYADGTQDSQVSTHDPSDAGGLVQSPGYPPTPENSSCDSDCVDMGDSQPPTPPRPAPEYPTLLSSVSLTPPPSPPPLWDEEEPADEIDGWLSSAFYGTVKTAVLHLLVITINKYRTANCYGCQTSHPSQKEHPCLEPLDDVYYSINFQGLMKMLYKPKFIPAVQCLLNMHNLPSDEVRVRAAAEMILHNLKDVDATSNSMFDH